MVLEYHCWYTANIVIISVFNAFSIGSGFMAAVLLRVKRDVILFEACFFHLIELADPELIAHSLDKLDLLTLISSHHCVRVHRHI